MVLTNKEEFSDGKWRYAGDLNERILELELHNSPPHWKLLSSVNIVSLYVQGNWLNYLIHLNLMVQVKCERQSYTDKFNSQTEIFNAYVGRNICDSEMVWFWIQSTKNNLISRLQDSSFLIMI